MIFGLNWDQNLCHHHVGDMEKKKLKKSVCVCVVGKCERSTFKGWLRLGYEQKKSILQSNLDWY